MTFAIVAYSKQEKQLGLAIASCGLFTGSICPVISKDGTYIGTVQACVSQKLKSNLANLIDSGTNLSSIPETLFETDKYSSYRQIAVINQDCAKLAYTGKDTLAYSDHIAGDNFIAIGNMLSSRSCLSSIAEQFKMGESLPLTERLVRCLEKAKEVSGQKANGKQLRERASALFIIDQNTSNNFSLRIDMDTNAIVALRKLWDTYRTYDKLMVNCDSDPTNLPSLEEQEKALIMAPSIFS